MADRDAGAAARAGAALRCRLAVASTGIIDSHALMLAFQSDAEAAGAVVVLRTPVLSGRVRDDGFDLAIGGEEADRHPLSLPRQCSWALCARRETPPWRADPAEAAE